MIILDQVSCSLSAGRIVMSVLDRASLRLPSDQHLVVLGQPGSGKTSLIRLLAGSMLPDQGRIERHARLSFPAGFSGGYKRDLSVRENLIHAASLYGADPDEVVDFVARVAELGQALYMDFGDLPQQLRLRLAYAVSYAIPFDTYLIDNRIAMGDPEFRLRCERIFEARVRSCGFILTTSNARYARRLAKAVAILHGGRLVLYQDPEQAIREFESLERTPTPAPLGGRMLEAPAEAED